MRELINNVIQWAADRDILNGSNALKQLDKTSEELNELQRALGQWYMLDELVACDAITPTSVVKQTQHEVELEVMDAYGDVLVTLIIASKLDGIDIQDALASAWNTIKDRKGRLINGKFVKETE